MPKSTAEQFIAAVTEIAGTHQRADASDREQIIKDFYQRHSALLSEALSGSKADETITAASGTALTTAEMDVLTGLKSLLESKANSPSTKNKALLKMWQDNLTTIITSMTLSPSAAAAAATTHGLFTPGTSTAKSTPTTPLAGKHRNPTSG